MNTEKPVAESLDGALRLAAAARLGRGDSPRAVENDKLFLPGIIKLRRLTVKGALFGLNPLVRLEFGYWVFEGKK